MTRTRDLLNGAHAGVRWARGRLESMVLSTTVWLGTPGVGSASTPKDSKLPCRQDRPVPSARALQRQTPATPSGGGAGHRHALPAPPVGAVTGDHPTQDGSGTARHRGRHRRRRARESSANSAASWVTDAAVKTASRETCCSGVF